MTQALQYITLPLNTEASNIQETPNLAQLAAGMYKIYILYLSSEPRPRLRPSQKTPRSHKPLTLRTTNADLEYPANRKHQQIEPPPRRKCI